MKKEKGVGVVVETGRAPLVSREKFNTSEK